MQTLKVDLFLPFAQYRNPFTFFYAQTFPLPPKSTIVGMLQNLTGEYFDNKYWDLKICVFGIQESIFWNYQQLIKGVPVPVKSDFVKEEIGKSGKVMQIKETKVDYSTLTGGDKLPLYGVSKKSQRTPVYQQEIYNLRLTIFIKHEDVTFIQGIKSSFANLRKVMHLGRSEDIFFIRKAPEIVTFEEKELWDFSSTFGSYILRADNSILDNEKHFPVYSIPTRSIFELNEKPIQSQKELFSNKQNIKRKVDYNTVYYAENNRLVFLEKKPVMFYKGEIEGNEIKYYLIDQSWL